MAWYNSMKDLKGSLSSGGKKLLGGREDSGILGTGQFRSKEYQIKDNAFNSEATNTRQQQFANALLGNNRSAPTMSAATIDQKDANEWQGRQRSLANALQAQMEGRGGPSLAEMQMQRGLNQSLANANAQAASMRGVNPALALRQTQNAAMNAQQQNVGETAMLRAQEQQAARQQFGDLSTSARTQSADMAKSQAELQQAAATNNQRAALDQANMNDARERFLREGQMTMDERSRQANIERERMKSQQSVGYNQINSGAYQSAAQNRAGLGGGIAGGIAAVLASDERLKTDATKVSFNSPADSTFKPKIEESKPETDTFEPTREAASQKTKDDILKYMSSKSSESGNKDGFNKMGQGMGQAAAAAAVALSDGNAKTDKSGGNGKVNEFLNALQAYTYKYKEPEKFGQGQQLGVMAQDLEKSDIGKSMVMDTPEGKMVDYAKGAGAMLASQAMLNERLQKLEQALGRKSKARAS